MRPTNENSLGDVIAEMLKKYHLEDGYWSAKITEAWGKCLSDYIVKRTSSIIFKNGLLQVYVNSSVIRKELLLISEEVMNQLNEELGIDIIKELRIL